MAAEAHCVREGDLGLRLARLVRHVVEVARGIGMLVVAIPNPHFPPGDEALGEANVVLGSLEELAPNVFESASSRRGP